MHPVPFQLPEFDEPPLVETVLSVQFEPLHGVRVAHLGLLWTVFRDLYPRTSERVPLEPSIERFPLDAQAHSQPLLQVLTDDVPPVPRFWFINESGSELIQVQNDRFVKNWRKSSAGTRYPRYESIIRPNFDRDYQKFVGFLEEQGLGTPRINQCEVTYINHILTNDEWSSLSEVEKVVTIWNKPGWPTAPLDDCRISSRFVIPDSAGSPIGRLTFELQPALQQQDRRPMYVLRLTARGLLGDGLAFLDIGREWIVRAFEGLTTPSMHRAWKRRER